MSWMRKNPITAFLTIAFSVSWVGWTASEIAPLQLFFDEEGAALARELMFLSGYGVSLAGLIVTAVLYGRKGIFSLFARFFRWKAPVIMWIYIFLAPIIFAVISRAFLVQSLGADLVRIEPWQVITLFKPSMLAVIIIAPLAEEAGWRGFLLPKLLEQHSALTASLLIGVIWAMWHFPLSFMSESFTEVFQDPIKWIGYMIFVVCISIQITIFFLLSRNSLLIALVFHWVINARNSVVESIFPDVSSDTWDMTREAPDLLVATLVPWVISTFILIIVFWSKITTNYNDHVPSDE